MCGISGVWSIRNTNPTDDEFNKFFSAIKHRGPNDSKHVSLTSHRIMLGFHRLSIVDLTCNAMQPMVSKNGRYTIVFNGEIYNHELIRVELEKLGHKFQSNSDTEVVLLAFQEWGPNCLKHFNGMWALAIWDSKNEKLFCARDRFGVKPFYYGEFNGRFYFSSELKSFNQIPRTSIHLNYEHLNGSLNPDTLPITLYSEVSKLCPGEAMYVEGSGIARKFKWWDPMEGIRKAPVSNVNEVVEEFTELLESSCLLRATCDVPFAISLSGGLDSSSILAFTLSALKKKTPQRLNDLALFHQTFGDSQEDESKYAHQVADYFGLTLASTQVGPNISFETVRNAVVALESNSINPIGIWTHYKEISLKGYSVVLEGHGADELLSGYPFMAEDYAREMLKSLRVSSWVKLRKLVHNIVKDNVQIDSKQSLLSLFALDVRKLTQESIDPLKKAIRNLKPKTDGPISQDTQSLMFFRDEEVRRCISELSPLSAIRFFNFHYKTLPNILSNFDKLSMAHGVEVRSPFLDWRIVSFLLSQQSNLFLRDGLSKWILRETVKENLPRGITYRKNKRGFAPSIYWMRGSLGLIAQEIVHSSSFNTFGSSSLKEFRTSFDSAYKNASWNELLSYWGIIQLNILVNELGVST